MKVLGRTRKVDKAIKAALREVKLALKEVNQQAAKLVANGKYSEADALVQVAKKVQEFQVEVDSLRAKWRGIKTTGANNDPSTENPTPLWKFYHPILQVLMALGGEATRRALESQLATSLASELSPGDFKVTARGVPRWKVMVKRARKPMVHEGFIETGTSKLWRITHEGRRAAQNAEVGEPKAD